MKIETILAQAGSFGDERTGAVTMPIYQTATFRHPGVGESTGFDYSRSGNPTRAALEDTLARLDGGARGFAFASGLAGISAVLGIFEPGARIVVTEDLYGGTFRLFEKILNKSGILAVYVDTSDTEAVRAALKGGAQGLFIESPTNPLLKIADIGALCALAKEAGALAIVDNTFLTPAFQKPLELGADIAVYSASKYLGGHNDIVAGAVVAKNPEIADKIYFNQNAVGGVLAPFDSWLLLRGLKTLSVRLERQEQNALGLAEFLTGHPKITKVFYPGLKSHKGHETQKGQATGFGGMLSVEVESTELVHRVLKKVKVFSFAESLGGVESLITFPMVQTHADIAKETLVRLGINDRLLRLSVGIESLGDLVEDLKSALE